MTIIWYNPDVEQYEFGSMADYSLAVNISSQSNRFEILYEFSPHESAMELAPKITGKLNRVRAQARRAEIFA